jgi:hypothetical protein
MISARTERDENELMYDFEDVRRRLRMGKNQLYAAFRRGEIPGQVRFGNGRWLPSNASSTKPSAAAGRPDHEWWRRRYARLGPCGRRLGA